MPTPRIVVGGEFNRWLNITRTVTVQGAEDPDSSIFMCEVCQNITTFEGCSVSNYTQFTIGSPPVVGDTSGELSNCQFIMKEQAQWGGGLLPVNWLVTSYSKFIITIRLMFGMKKKIGGGGAYP